MLLLILCPSHNMLDIMNRISNAVSFAIKLNTSTNLMKAIHYMKIYCTQIWCSLLPHVNIIMSWFWKGRHFRNASEKAICLVKLGFISSKWNASMNHFDRSALVYCSWLVMEDKQTKRMTVYNDSFQEESCWFALYRHSSPRVGFPCRSLGGTTGLSWRCHT